MNLRAGAESLLVAAGGCFMITWVHEGSALKDWGDLISFVFITKAVSTFVLLTGMNQYFANRTFRGDPPEKIEKRIQSDISELKNLPAKPEVKDIPPKED